MMVVVMVAVDSETRTVRSLVVVAAEEEEEENGCLRMVIVVVVWKMVLVLDTIVGVDQSHCS
jgi:hypothetical protein